MGSVLKQKFMDEECIRQEALDGEMGAEWGELFDEY